MQRDGGVGPSSSSRVPRGEEGGRGAAELRTYRDRRKALWPPREDQDLPGIDIWGTVGSGAGRPWGQ